MTRQNNTSNTHLAWTMLGLNLLAALLLTGGIWYSRNESARLLEQYTALASVRINASQQEAVSELLTETVAERVILTQSIITEDSLPTLIESLEEMGRISNVELQLTQATPSSENNPNIKLVFSTSGAYQSLVDFTRLLDALPVQMRIQGAQLHLDNQDSEGVSRWQATYHVELLGYGI